MEDLKDKTLSFVRQNGPVLPVQIAKAIERDQMYAGAILSELASEGLVFLTTAKIGTSKLYYVKGQEEKLQKLREHIGSTPRKAYDLLHENKIVKDVSCEPYQRVAFREDLKDFAKPFKENEELYWRWYLVTEEEAKTLLKPKEEVKVEEPIEEVVKEEHEVQTEEPLKNEPEVKVEEPKKEEKQNTLTKIIPKKPNKKIELKIPEELNEFFIKNGIMTGEVNFVKKQKEIETLAKVQTPFGLVKYLIIFMDKKKINDGDLGLIYTRGQNKRSPVLLLSQGELTKKAEKYLEDNYNGSIIFKKL